MTDALSIELRASWLTIMNCPRWIGQSGTIVERFGSRLPAEVLYANAPSSDGGTRLAEVGLEPEIGVDPEGLRRDE